MVRDESALAPALHALALEANRGVPPREVTLVEFARTDLIGALREFEEASPWSRIIHVSAPEQLRLDRLCRRATPPAIYMEDETIKLEVSDDHLLPSMAERMLYSTDGVDSVRTSRRWRDKLFEIDNSFDDDGSHVSMRIADFIESVINPYRQGFTYTGVVYGVADPAVTGSPVAGRVGVT